MMPITDQIITELKSFIDFNYIINKILEDGSLKLKGMPGSMKTLFLWSLAKQAGRPLLVVLKDENSAELLADELMGFSDLGSEAACFPGHVERAGAPGLLNSRRAGLQMEILHELLSGSIKILVTDSLGALQKLPDVPFFNKHRIPLSRGAEYDLSDLMNHLADFGYDRESMVERPGEISVRGGILDIYPYTGELPHRIEFLGNTIESIRSFDVATQRSIQNIDSLTLISSPLHWRERSTPLWSYFQSPPLLFIEDSLLVIETMAEEAAGDSNLIDSSCFQSLADSHPTFYYSSFASGDAYDLGGRGVDRPGRFSQEIREHLLATADSGNTVYVAGEGAEQVSRIAELLELEFPPPGIRIGVAPIREGFALHESRMFVYTLAELFGTPRKKQKHRRIKAGMPLRELSSLSKGDYVVHIDHGIGIYEGLKIIKVNDIDSECLSIKYQDDDRLYVPLDKMTFVSKYASRDGAVPTITKLGGDRWEKLKTKTKATIRKTAEDLVRLYSERQVEPGFSYSPDTPWQKELEASFLYEETPDQASAIREVKRDMESDRPMDRLICGDVGFGKTEVAIRAAFKAVQDGKQVAVLVPTTLLAEQHFRTFYDRFVSYPVRVEVLSRFKSKSEQKALIADMKAGKADIIVGTHRLISKDIGFRDLGLLIVDEEQRFGVRHKEKLKALRKSVDVIALSATPIPRTLHLSLVGIRDMSLITSPPQDRLPILTEVIPFHEETIISALEREMERGGQTFFVHNRVRSIYSVAGMIRRMVPGIRLAVVHGQMEEKKLEKTMIGFLNKEYDCLVATMIIGSGLDIPNANTLIVHRADRLGLSQLYQLRGRVGRSGRRAYAYLLTPPLGQLTAQAIKRLRTIEEYTELGAGFQIAMRDLEIRGTGNILGVAQSGHIDAVGFDLYNRLVEEAVREIKEESESGAPDTVPPLKVECRIDVHVPALLPSDYVEDESQRVNMYRRINRCVTDREVDRVAEELADRYGSLPEAAKNLLEMMRLRLIASAIGIERMNVSPGVLTCYFHEKWVDNHPSPELFNRALRSFIDSSPSTIRFLQGHRFGFKLEIPEKQSLYAVKKSLQRWG